MADTVTISNKKVLKALKNVRVGDYLLINVIKKLSDNRYRIMIKDVELVAVFKGVVPVNRILYAVASNLSPYLSLRVVDADTNLSKKADDICRVLQKNDRYPEFTPSLADLFASLYDDLLAEQGVQECLTKDGIYGEIVKIKEIIPVLDNVAALNDFESFFFIVKSTFSCVNKRVKVLSENETDFFVKSELIKISEVIETILLLLELLDRRKNYEKGFSYYPFFFRLDGRFSVCDLYVLDDFAECWLNGGMNAYFKVEFERGVNRVILKRAMYNNSDVINIDKFLNMAGFFLKKEGISFNSDVFLSGNAGIVKPLCERFKVSIRGITNFSIVV